MIKSCQRDKLWAFLFERLPLTKIKHIQKRLLNCLKVLHRERSWKELKNFFRDDLEELTGNWKGWCSIRLNKQYRIVFQWSKDNHAYQVDLTKHYRKAKI